MTGEFHFIKKRRQLTVRVFGATGLWNLVRETCTKPKNALHGHWWNQCVIDWIVVIRIVADCQSCCHRVVHVADTHHSPLAWLVCENPFSSHICVAIELVDITLRDSYGPTGDTANDFSEGFPSFLRDLFCWTVHQFWKCGPGNRGHRGCGGWNGLFGVVNDGCTTGCRQR